MLGTCSSFFLSVDGIQVTATMLEIPPIPVIRENVQASITIIDVVESTWIRFNVKTLLFEIVILFFPFSVNLVDLCIILIGKPVIFL